MTVRKYLAKKSDVERILGEDLGLAGDTGPDTTLPAVMNEPQVEDLPVSVTPMAEDDPVAPPVQDDAFVPGNVKELQRAVSELTGYIPPPNVKAFYHRLKRLVSQSLEIEKGEAEMAPIEPMPEPEKQLEKEPPEQERRDKTEDMLKRQKRKNSHGVEESIKNQLRDIIREALDDDVDSEDLKTIKKWATAIEGSPSIAKQLIASIPERMEAIRRLSSPLNYQKLSRIPGVKVADAKVVYDFIQGLESEAAKDAAAAAELDAAKEMVDDIDVFKQKSPEDVAGELGLGVQNARNVFYDFDIAFGIDKPGKAMPVAMPDPAKIGVAAALMDVLYDIFSEAADVVLPEEIFQKYIGQYDDLGKFDESSARPFKELFFAFSRMASKKAFGERSIRKVMKVLGPEAITDADKSRAAIRKVVEWWYGLDEKQKKQMLKGALDKVKM